MQKKKKRKTYLLNADENNCSADEVQGPSVNSLNEGLFEKDVAETKRSLVISSFCGTKCPEIPFVNAPRVTAKTLRGAKEHTSFCRQPPVKAAWFQLI